MDNYYPDFRNHTNDMGDDVGKDFARLIPQCRMHISKDLPRLVEISKACFRGNAIGQHWNLSDFQRALKNGILIAVRLDEVGRECGFVAYQWNPCYYQIWNLAVAPGLNLRGHGRALVNHVTGHMRYGRQELTIVDISYQTPKAMTFFHRLGFRHKHTRNAGSVSISARYVLKLTDTFAKQEEAVATP